VNSSHLSCVQPLDSNREFDGAREAKHDQWLPLDSNREFDGAREAKHDQWLLRRLKGLKETRQLIDRKIAAIYIQQNCRAH